MLQSPNNIHIAHIQLNDHLWFDTRKLTAETSLILLVQTFEEGLVMRYFSIYALYLSTSRQNYRIKSKL